HDESRAEAGLQPDRKHHDPQHVLPQRHRGSLVRGLRSVTYVGILEAIKGGKGAVGGGTAPYRPLPPPTVVRRTADTPRRRASRPCRSIPPYTRASCRHAASPCPHRRALDRA